MFQFILLLFCRNFGVNPMDTKSGDTNSDEYLSLVLSVAPYFLGPNYMLGTKFKFFLYNQMYGEHIEREGT
jgi:hypothetical protein